MKFLKRSVISCSHQYRFYFSHKRVEILSIFNDIIAKLFHFSKTILSLWWKDQALKVFFVILISNNYPLIKKSKYLYSVLKVSFGWTFWKFNQFDFDCWKFSCLKKIRYLCESRFSGISFDFSLFEEMEVILILRVTSFLVPIAN